MEKTKAEHIEEIKKSSIYFEMNKGLLKDDKEICLVAVKQSGLNYQYVSLDLKDDKEVAVAAFNSDIKSFFHFSERLLKDDEFVFKTVKNALKEMRKSSSLDDNYNYNSVMSLIKSSSKELHARLLEYVKN